jgi:hypothetical protein
VANASESLVEDVRSMAWAHVLGAAVDVSWWCFGIAPLGAVSTLECFSSSPLRFGGSELQARLLGIVGIVIAGASAWQWFRPRSASRTVEVLRCLLLALPLTFLGTVEAVGLDAKMFVQGSLLLPSTLAVWGSVYLASILLMLAVRLRAPAGAG